MVEVTICETAEALGAEAARAVATALRNRLAQQAMVRMIFAAAPSQSAMLFALRHEAGIDWSRVTAFHMDEYLGLPPNASQRFGNWLQREFFDHVSLGHVHLIPTDREAQSACREYALLLAEKPIDMVLLGIGTNGHLAFNDPPADLHDPETVKVVTLDKMCREQQVFDGCFATLENVPVKAITLTVPMLLSAQEIFGCIPGKHKSAAVRAMLEDAISGACPATALRMHPKCSLFLDRASSSRSKFYAQP